MKSSIAMSSIKKKKISKKSKSAWRKTDIKDVEHFLEEQRQDERIGTFDEKQDEELFVVDTGPHENKKVGLSEKQKRKLNAKKPLRTLQPLINTSKVQDPIAKRNHVKQKKCGRIKEEEVKNPTKPRHFQANKDRSLYYADLDNRKKGKSPSKDVWMEEDFREQIPGLKDDKGWISHKLALHVANNIGKKVIQAPDILRHRTTKAKNFEAPHPGMSYNPSFKDYQHLIDKVVEREDTIIKEEMHLKRVTTQMFSKVTAEERDRRRIEEMSAGLDESIIEENADKMVSTNPFPNPPVENKKKTRQARNKEARHKKLLKQQEQRKALKKQIAELNRLKSVKAEVIEAENQLDEMKKRRKKNTLKKKYEPKRLSKVKFTEPDVDVNMVEDIPGNLRNVKPESSLLIDRFKSFQRRNILPASLAASKQKRKKVKRFVRSSHKQPEVSIQEMRKNKKVELSS